MKAPRLAASAIAMLFATSLAACGSSGGGSSGSDDSGGNDSSEEIVIGLIDEQSGPTAAVQGPAGDGVRLAVEEINDGGGIDGRQIKLVTRDTGGDAGQAIQGVNELAQEGAVAIVGPVNGGICQAVAPTLAELELPGFCLSPVDLPQEDDYIYGIGLELSQEDEYVFDLLGEENGKVGVLSQKTPVLDLLNRHIETYASDLDVQVETVETTDTTAKAQMQSLIDAGVGGILLAPCGPLSLTAAQEAIDLGYDQPIFLWNCWASDAAAEQIAPFANGSVWTVAPTFILGDVSDDDPQKPAIDAYEAAGGEPDIVFAAGWDGMQVLAGAIAEGGATSEEIYSTLQGGYSYEGVWSVGTITAEDHRGVSADGAMRLVAFTPEGTMEPIEGS